MSKRARPEAAAAAGAASASAPSSSKSARIETLEALCTLINARIERSINDSNTNTVQIAQRILNDKKELIQRIETANLEQIKESSEFKQATNRALSELTLRIAELEAENKKLREAAKSK